QKLPEDSSVLRHLETMLPGRLVSRRAGAALHAPYLRLEGDWATFWKRVRPSFRKKLRNIHNRLARAGRVRVEEHRSVDPEGPLFQEMIEVSRRGWKAQQGVSMATMK